MISAGKSQAGTRQYVKFEKLGFMIIGLFDVNPALDGVTVRGIKIRMLDELEDFQREQSRHCSAYHAEGKSGRHCQPSGPGLGIHAIWNFAHVDLELINKDVVVENVHLSDSLMQLSYNICEESARQREQPSDRLKEGTLHSRISFLLYRELCSSVLLK